MIEPRSIIKDYNSEGLDSVDSEDFDPGFGCVIVELNRPIAAPPPVKDTLTETDRRNIYYLHESEIEREAREDEFLGRHGIR